MIGPVSDFTELIQYFDGDRYLVERGDLPGQSALDAHAEKIARDVGIAFQKHECVGAYLLLPMPDGTRKEVRRDRLYSLCTRAEVLEAVEATVRAIRSLRGPGCVWTLAGRVHLISEGDELVAVKAKGSSDEHVCVRAFFCHEQGVSK